MDGSVLILLYLLGLRFGKCEANFAFGGPNIARGKPASQWPGQFINAAAGNAVDGDTSVDVRALDRCAYTRQGTKTHPAWWNVDLGTTYAITGLKIYNIDRHDNRARLSNMAVTGDGIQIYKDASNKDECFDTFPTEGLDVCSDVIAIPVHGSSAQNLNISTADYLTMCEVEVFAEVCGLPAIANGRLSGTKKTVFKPGESVTVSCDAGFDATNSPSTCHEDRTWKPVPDCVDVTCREIPDHMKQEEAILDFPELTVGELANVTYNSTIFHLAGGSVELRCTATRELAWTASPVFVPFCTVLPVEHGLANSSTCLTPDKCQTGTTLQYSCAPRFVVSAHSTTCLEDHTWDTTPFCTKELAPESNDNAIIAGAAVGGLLLVVIAVGLVACICKRRKSRTPCDTETRIDHGNKDRTSVYDMIPMDEAMASGAKAFQVKNYQALGSDKHMLKADDTGVYQQLSKTEDASSVYQKLSTT